MNEESRTISQQQNYNLTKISLTLSLLEWPKVDTLLFYYV